MDTLFQEMVEKGLVEVVRRSPNFTLALAGTVPYRGLLSLYGRVIERLEPEDFEVN